MLLCYQARFEWDVWVIFDCYNKLTSDPCSGLECCMLALANRKAVRPNEREDLNSRQGDGLEVTINFSFVTIVVSFQKSQSQRYFSFDFEYFTDGPSLTTDLNLSARPFEFVLMMVKFARSRFAINDYPLPGFVSSKSNFQTFFARQNREPTSSTDARSCL